MSRRILIVVAVLSLVAGACAGNNPTIELEAVFDDVVELVPRHQVKTADVAIGTVTSVELTDDYRALVRMRVRADTGLPADVLAEVKKTQVLGEYYVNLVPLTDQGTLSSGPVTATRTAAELEELIASGTEFLAYIAADQLSAAVHAGAITFGGRGGTFGSVLTSLEQFFTRYSQREEDVTRLLDGLDMLLDGVTPVADVHGEALEAFARSARALEQEDERLLDALEDLRRLAVVGERILREHRGEIDNFWRRTELILAELTRIEDALENFLFWWPMHNLHLPAGILNEHGQIWADIIFCDTPTEERDNNTMTCFPPNPAQPSQPPPDYELDDCDVYHEGCDWPPGVEPKTDRER
jgi:phospholipid/cholesterol/gamma-HCH transport system substrate-binding protein